MTPYKRYYPSHPLSRMMNGCCIFVFPFYFTPSKLYPILFELFFSTNWASPLLNERTQYHRNQNTSNANKVWQYSKQSIILRKLSSNYKVAFRIRVWSGWRWILGLVTMLGLQLVRNRWQALRYSLTSSSQHPVNLPITQAVEVGADTNNTQTGVRDFQQMIRLMRRRRWAGCQSIGRCPLHPARAYHTESNPLCLIPATWMLTCTLAPRFTRLPSLKMILEGKNCRAFYVLLRFFKPAAVSW